MDLTNASDDTVTYVAPNISARGVVSRFRNDVYVEIPELWFPSVLPTTRAQVRFRAGEKRTPDAWLAALSLIVSICEFFLSIRPDQASQALNTTTRLCPC